MQRGGHRRIFWGVVGAIGLGIAVAWAQTAAPPKAKLERLRIAVAPLTAARGDVSPHTGRGEAP